MTRVAFVTPSFAPEVGGAETYTAHAIAALGMPVDVVAPATRDAPRSAEAAGATVHRVGRPGSASRARRTLAFAEPARHALAELRPDVVVAQYSGLWPAARHAREAGIPLVALVHDVYGLRENLRWRGMGGVPRHLANDRLLSLVRPDAVVAVSEATAGAVRRVVRAPVVVARPGADHVPAGPSPAEGSRTLLFVGRLVRSKGPADAGRAAGLVRREVPGARLRLIGTGPERRSLPWWAEVEAALDDDALDRAFRAAGCLVFPSRREGWGLVVTEAAARGLPYVAYDIPAVREQHELVRGGVLVPAGDAEAMGRAAARILADPIHRRVLGGTGRERSRSLLRWSDAAFAIRCAISLALDGAAALREEGARR